MRRRWSASTRWAERHWFVVLAIGAVLVGGLMAVVTKPLYGLANGVVFFTGQMAMRWARDAEPQPRKWVLAATATGCAATVAVAIAVNGPDDRSECQLLQRRINQIEQESTLDEAQAWEDIYALQSALGEVMRLRYEMRLLGCG